MAVLGFPNGSLSEHTRQLLEAVGMEMPPGLLTERKYSFPLPPSELYPFDGLLVLRPQDMPLAVSVGMVDAGFSGMDWLVEAGQIGESLVAVAAFDYSKATTKKAPAIVVLGRPGQEFHDTEETIVATEYPVLARRRFKMARIIVVRGKAEAWVVGGYAHFCVDLCDLGTTCRANNLVIVGEPIISSPTILLARKDSPFLPAIRLFAEKLLRKFAELAEK